MTRRVRGLLNSFIFIRDRDILAAIVVAGYDSHDGAEPVARHSVEEHSRLTGMFQKS